MTDPGDASTDGGDSVWRCPAGPFPSPLTGAATRAEPVSGVPPDDTFAGATILEGPVWKDDRLYLSEFQGVQSRIVELDPTGVASVIVAAAGVNGLALDRRGDLVGACYVDGSICRFSKTPPYERSVVVGSYEGVPFAGVNDLAIRSDETIYFSDLAAGRVYRVAPDGSVSIADQGLNQPNGVTLSPDETTLYVAEYIAATERHVYRYAVAADGSLGPRQSFDVGGGDGMAVDCAGNLYVARGRDVIVLDAGGAELGVVSAGVAEGTTNVAFGGPARTTLYVTSWGAPHRLFAVTLAVPGMPY